MSATTTPNYTIRLDPALREEIDQLAALAVVEGEVDESLSQAEAMRRILRSAVEEQRTELLSK